MAGMRYGQPDCDLRDGRMLGDRPVHRDPAGKEPDHHLVRKQAMTRQATPAAHGGPRNSAFT